MHVVTLNFHGNPNVGLYGYCGEVDGKRLCLLGEQLNDDDEAQIAEALDAELHHLTIAGTPMPGVFLAGNSHTLLVPAIAFDREHQHLTKLGFPVKVFHSRLTCFGNNIVTNDHGCLVNPDFSDTEMDDLRDLLGVPVKRIEIAGLKTPGACVVLNGKRGVIHRDAAAHEIAMVKETLKLDELEPASVNLGSPFVRAGILNNDQGFVVSDASGGPEIVHLEQSLGYGDRNEG